ncbi:DUF4037 domain-containing protein [Olsenella sp. HMSC062G07]|uniref:DUF4037 domain-containing protein n=1 Tax=Olsenella sp. HMSC062G07 TaxID=1739330 RepID=UPI0008A460A7|nr:DUF4037 domain-containing protein [Olsenella sp. HMSC062G07]OFK23685.1 hypothetical protein HMPREF2826_04090 [Olsenella sp. HMSC062G07]
MGVLDDVRAYVERVAAPALAAAAPDLWPRVACGLVGNGSECLGLDDGLSRDHDWGIDFYLWVLDEDADQLPRLERLKAKLMREHPPAHVRTTSEFGVGPRVMTVSAFYTELIGRADVPVGWRSWRDIPEENLLLATNGAVFVDGPGTFSAVRRGLLGYYPRDLWLKRMAARCMALAQTGQYNLARMAARGDVVAVNQTLARFIDEAEQLTFLLNRAYRPYYKWAWRMLCELPELGPQVGELLRRLVGAADDREGRQRLVDEVCALLLGELRRQGLVTTGDWFLATAGAELQGLIDDPVLRAVPPQYD